MTRICDRLFGSVYQSPGVDLTTPFSCDGGGSGTMTVDGNQIRWNGNFTFDDCVMNVDGDTLTLTGIVVFDADPMNEVYGGMSDSLAIHGDVASCTQPLNETCAASWHTLGYPLGSDAKTDGKLCGRDFP